ncbi:hypothetical protein IU403_04755 [Aerococcaceae bacterium zg-BR22]|uniref:hypothetical protein n=1 Tax=Aerococcaceae bacterium zg-1292 TaxID=2774330 RepID=UPI0040637F9B|nr:hypothetical protein [Aerococcaceae bacterium zg-BR22]
MKKLILFVLLLALALVSYLTYQSVTPPVSSPNTTPITTAVNESTVADVTTMTTEATTQAPVAKSLFDEKIIGESDYPTATVPPRLAGMDIYNAINKYYQEHYSQDEKTANQSEISADELQSLQEVLNNHSQLSNLNISVDQVTMTLDGQNVYIPRIIVPMTYAAAQQTLPDNDLTILSESMTQLGNRLIMIAYYDEADKTLTVYHLTNWTNPLFTYKDEA